MGEIAFQKSRTGLEVATYDGRQLSSFVDPEHEAKQWCSHYSSILKTKKSIVVLGLACGYHVKALEKVFFKKIYVIEKIDSFRERWAAENPNSTVSLFSPEQFALHLQNGHLELPYGVLTFAPAAVIDLELYRKLNDRLNGRHVSALSKQFALRGQSHFFLPNDLNFKDPKESFRRLAISEGVSEKWRSLFKLLGDIVK